MEQEELNKKARVETWYRNGLNAGFTAEQLDFLAEYFAFFSDILKDLSDFT